MEALNSLCMSACNESSIALRECSEAGLSEVVKAARDWREHQLWDYKLQHQRAFS